MSPKQTKHRKHSQFVTDRISPEVLAPHRLPIKLTVMLSFFSCSEPCGLKMTHLLTPHSTDNELIRFDIWQSPLHFYWTGNKIHLLNSSPFLQPHQETFPPIWSFSAFLFHFFCTCGDAGPGSFPLSTS